LAKKKVEEKEKQPKRKRSVTLEASESSSAFCYLTTEEEILDTVTPTIEHDAIQAAAIREPQDQEYECF